VRPVFAGGGTVGRRGFLAHLHQAVLARGNGETLDGACVSEAWTRGVCVSARFQLTGSTFPSTRSRKGTLSATACITGSAHLSWPTQATRPERITTVRLPSMTSSLLRPSSPMKLFWIPRMTMSVWPASHELSTWLLDLEEGASLRWAGVSEAVHTGSAARTTLSPPMNTSRGVAPTRRGWRSQTTRSASYPGRTKPSLSTC
jgi:hypothetical protein